MNDLERLTTTDEDRCDLCGGNHFAALPLSTPDYRLGIPGSFQLHRCLDCGLVSLHPQPDPETMAQHYPDLLWEIEMGDVVQTSKANTEFAVLQRWHPSPGRLLDVGCGSGDFVLAAQNAGWDALGIEVGDRQVEAARKRGANAVKCADFLLFDATGRFDAVTFHHVIEHVPSPKRYLHKAGALLRPGGLLMISIPNFDSLSARLYGRYWIHLDLPRHFYHFTPKTLRALVEQVGFHVLEIRYDAREHDSAGIRGSFQRWVKYGLRHRPLSKLGVSDSRIRIDQQASLSRRLAVDGYRFMGNALAQVTEWLHMADTFMLTARRSTNDD
jgi:SAM-dependent methyltransferase